jgi:hypothetical protein
VGDQSSDHDGDPDECGPKSRILRWECHEHHS